MLLFAVNTISLVILSIALTFSIVEFIRFKRKWRIVFILFLVYLITQNFIIFFDDYIFPSIKDPIAQELLSRQLVIPQFIANTLILFIFTELFIKRKLRVPRTVSFLLCLVILTIISIMKPDFWLNPKADLAVITAYAAFFIIIALFTYELFEGMKHSRKQVKPESDLFLFYIILLIGSVTSTIMSQAKSLFSQNFIDFYLPSFNALLGIYIAGSKLSYILSVSYVNYRTKPLPEFFTEFDLSKRESELTELLCIGKNARQSAETLFISRKTINSHLHNIYRKCGVSSKTELILLVQSFIAK